MVSLIGALLREFPERWTYYLRLLQRKQFKRIRKSSSYDYEALDQAMDASLQVLEPEHQNLYRDLTIMQKDIKVPAKVRQKISCLIVAYFYIRLYSKFILVLFSLFSIMQVLSVLWGLELEEVEDVLQEFVNKSLLFRDCNQRPYLYYLHDLQLDFLTEQNRDQIAVSYIASFFVLFLNENTKEHGLNSFLL